MQVVITGFLFRGLSEDMSCYSGQLDFMLRSCEPYDISTRAQSDLPSGLPRFSPKATKLVSMMVC